jgi:hypothetical protein
MEPTFWFYVAAERLFWDQPVYSELLADPQLCLNLVSSFIVVLDLPICLPS